MRTIVDESLPSRRVANGQSIGVLEGLASDDSDPTDFTVGHSANALARYADLFPPDYWATGAASFGDLAEGPAAVTLEMAKPTHRLRVKFQGPPQKVVPITGDEQNEVATALQQRFGSRATVFFTSNSPVLTSRPGSGVYYYEVDVALHPDIDPIGAARSVSKLIEERRAFFGAGLRLIESTFDTLGAGVEKATMSLLKRAWKPATIVGGIALALYLLPTVMAVVRKRSGRMRRRRLRQ